LAATDFDKLVSFRDKLDREREKGPDRPVIAKLTAEYERRRAQLAGDEGLTVDEVERRIHLELHGVLPGEEGDDRVIGRVFWRSLAVVAGVAVAATAVVLWARRPAPPPPEQPIPTTAPQAVAGTAAEPPSLPFTDVTAAVGIDFVHANGATGDKLLPETMGGGVAFLDYDNDGDQDLLLVNGTRWPGDRGAGPLPTPALYANDGRGRFTDVTAAAGLGFSLYGMGAAAADYDGDGWTDLLLTAVGENRLLRNRGGRFTDVTAAAGVGGKPTQWTTCATFFDADGDGDLDLFVCHYVRWSRQIDFEVDYQLVGIGRAYGPPTNYQGAHSVLYRQEPDGTFTDVSEEAGIRVVNPATRLAVGKALGVAAVDADGDGDLDLLVANDTVGNFFFRNRGDGTFEEEGAALGVAYDRMGNATGAMGIDAGHLYNGPDLGFVIGNFSNEMTSVYLSQGDPSLYADEAIPSGIGAPSRTRLTFGVLLLDVDLDGRLDLLQTNGHLEDEIAQVDPSQSFRQGAQLFWNAGPQAPRPFLPMTDAALGDLPRPIVGRGSAFADMDGDGDLDVVMTQIAGPPLLLRNDQGTGHHHLRVLLDQEGGNRRALGAWIEVQSGGRTLRRPVLPARSYLSSAELPVTFGLGPATTVDGLTVVWPGGQREEIATAGLAVDTTVLVRRGRGRAEPWVPGAP
jgi:hypothetical protein